MKSTPRIVLGLGSGRCGTHSLAALLALQPRTASTHEFYGYDLPWTGGEPFVDALLARARASALDCFADAAFGYLPCAAYALAAEPELRCLCLRRERAATVASYRHWAGPRNHWMEHDGRRWFSDPWDQCYPKYAASDLGLALERYWDEYYAAAEALARAHPQRFRVFPMEALNTPDGQRAILGFCGFAPSAMRLQVGLRTNTGAAAGHLHA